MGRRRGRAWRRITAAACTVLLAAASAGCVEQPRPPDPDRSAAFALLEGFSARMLEEGAPAVLIAVSDPGGNWTHAAGVRSLESGERAEVSGPVRIGGITESLVAVSVMKLAAEGKLDLDSPVSRYLPEFGGVLHPPDPVSVRQLLTHESGLPDYRVPLLSSGRWEDVADRPLSLEQQLAMAGTLPWQRRLAHIFNYSRSNYAALALLVERLRGHTINRVLAADIAGPLDLKVTRLGGEAPAGMVHGYITVEGARKDVSMPAWQAASPTGAVSTVEEVNRFYAALLQGRLIPPDSVTAMKGGYSQYYGFALRRWNNTCNNRFYYGLPGDTDGYGTVSMTSEDGSRQLTMSVAYPPAPPTLEPNPLIYEMQDVAQQALNTLCGET